MDQKSPWESILNFIIAAGIVTYLLERLREWQSDRQVKRSFLKLLLYEVLVNIYACKNNLDAMKRIIKGDVGHSFRSVYSYEAWSIVKGSGKTHLFSEDEWTFFIEQYVQFKKYDIAYETWQKSHLDDKKQNIKALQENADRFERFIKGLEDSDFLKDKIDEAKDHLIERILREEGRSEEEIGAIMFGYRQNRSKKVAE